MNKKLRYFLSYSIYLLLVTILFSCHSHRFFKKNQEFHIASVNNNVCKKLQRKTVLYTVFVDSKYTGYWTEFDMSSTLDSVKKASKWIESQARDNGIGLDIVVDYHENDKGIIPIEKSLAKKRFGATLLGPSGIKNVDRWADKIAYYALQKYGPDTSKKTLNKIRPKDRERLIARLRDKHETENVGIIYFINSYYTDEVSAALHIGSDFDPEYAVVSYKNPSVIAHEYLHLFGAVDLYMSPFDNKKKQQKKKAFAMEKFPNEIMAFTHRRIETLEIGNISKYLIGWNDSLSRADQNILVGKKLKLVKY